MTQDLRGRSVRQAGHRQRAGRIVAEIVKAEVGDLEARGQRANARVSAFGRFDVVTVTVLW